MSRKVVGGSVVAAGLAAAAAGGFGVVGAAGKDGGAAAQSPLRFTDADVIAEVNATDGDAALLMKLGAENNWSRVSLTDPKGRRLFAFGSSGRLRTQGVVGLTLETGERAFDEFSLAKFKARFPKGRYTFRGTSLTGRRMVGTATLTHTIPGGARITAPAANSTVNPTSGVIVRWQGVTKPSGVKISGYDVIVAADESNREVVMELGPGARSAELPASFLERGQGYVVEVIARERSGNQAITEIGFKTS
jgi:hypothetical protein